jgi:aspartyl/asparaginyl beta-hydroxylase (cupin superfamily)
VHLGIDIPGGELIVANEQYRWKDAEIVVFDDSFLHSAKNNSDKVRVVLLFSIWHPDLNSEEILAIKRAFTHRQSWLEQRSVAT